MFNLRSKLNPTFFSFLGVALLFVSIAGSGFSKAESKGPDARYGEMAPDEAVTATLQVAGPGVVRSRPVAVDLAALGRRDGSGPQPEMPINLNFFTDVTFTARPDFVTSEMPGRLLWQGTVQGIPDSSVTIAVRGESASGTFFMNGRLYKMVPTASGHVVNEVDPNEPMPEMQPIPVNAPPKKSNLDQSEDVLSAEADDGSIIDVLVLYTPAARNGQGGTTGIESLIDLAVAETNQAYANSQISTQLRLVHSAEVVYTESGSFSIDLGRISSKTDGFMDGVHALRDTYGADVVSLITNSTQYCGIAYLMSTPSSGFESSAFNVVYRGCATGYFSFGHEIGHNQGSHHDRANAGSTPAYPYGYGYQDPAATFRTIMAYDCTSGCPRVQYFSNPNVTFNNKPTGIDHNQNPLTSAQNARSINETAMIVANFRPSAATPSEPPATPSGLEAIAFSDTEIDLTWIDNAENEAGYKIERSGDGGENYSQTNIVLANVTSYRDSGLLPSTTYFYRVRAYNAALDSAYSNVSNAKTDNPPPFVDYLADGEMTIGGTVAGLFLNTHFNEGADELITEQESEGKPKDRTSWLEHIWTFNVQPGAAVTLFMNGWVTDAGDGDQFEFYYSTNNQDYHYMFEVTASDDGPDYQSYGFPQGTSGPITIKVLDSDRTARHKDLDTIHVDHMFIRVENQPGDPPGRPTNVLALGLSSSAISVSWDYPGGDEYGFYLERSLDQIAWEMISSLPTGQSEYTDSLLSADTTYYYRVQAYNGSGLGPMSEITWAKTEADTTAYMHLALENKSAISANTTKRWDATVVVTVHDENHQPIANATIAGTWSSGAKGDGSCTSDVNGQCSISKSIRNNVSSVAFTVNTMVHVDYIYDPVVVLNHGADSILLVPLPQ